jgi:hypothetical protein
MLLDGKRVSVARRSDALNALGFKHGANGHAGDRTPLVVANEARKEPYRSGLFSSDRVLVEKIEEAKARFAELPRPIDRRVKIYLDLDEKNGRCFALRDVVPPGVEVIDEKPFTSLDDVVELRATKVRAVFNRSGKLVTIYPMRF